MQESAQNDRAYRVSVYVTRAEFAALERVAAAHGITAGAMLWRITAAELRRLVQRGQQVRPLDNQIRDKQLKVPITRDDYVRLRGVASSTAISLTRLVYRYSAADLQQLEEAEAA